jgi:hypothetical protein
MSSIQVPRGRSVLVVASVVLLFAGIPQAFATNDSETVGFTPNHTFLEGASGENLDVMNGGLTLEFPIGPEYRTSTTFSYQIVLRYNSKIWEYVGNESTGIADGRIRSYSQFGVGWTMHFGRIFFDAGKTVINGDELWSFETGDGAVHPMQCYSTTYATTELRGYCVTTDSTYIRAQRNAANGYWTVWFPDGSYLLLENNRQSPSFNPGTTPATYRDTPYTGV